MRGVIGRLECSMFDRHFLGDLTLAVLLALPAAAMAQPGAAAQQQTPAKASVEHSAAKDASPDRYGMLARG